MILDCGCESSGTHGRLVRACEVHAAFNERMRLEK